MQILENMDLCYGCSACANICPANAINMQPKDDGFLYPVVNEQTCINCNKCRQVCPQLHASYENSNTPPPEVYAAMANDDIRERSASGGVFSLLAEYAFNRKGYVCGAAFSKDFRHVKHIMIHSKKDLDALRRSKYVQSENGDIHKRVEEKLKTGEFVLFVGTPCQCASIKSYLRKSYDNLLLVDLICHGTPSPLAWNAFLEEITSGKMVTDVNFRYKGVKGWSATTHVEFADKETYTKIFKDDLFQQASSKNIISRKSCGTCQFARIPRQGDITIGDFWGIHTYNKNLDDRKGTSAILINNAKGKRVVQILKNQNLFKVLQEVPFYQAFSRNNANTYRFPTEHPGRRMFFSTLKNGGKFSEALAASKGAKHDVVLLSIWYAANYGSLMTNFALYKWLSDMGYNCIFADMPDHLWPKSKTHRDPLFVTRRFGCKYFKLTRKYKNKSDLRYANNLADTFIVGSDQIWNYNLCKTAETYFYLDFVDDYKKKISYGTSFGHRKFNGGEEEKKHVSFYLNRFDAVSVREDYAVDICRDSFGVEAVQVLDPVFMCDKKHYIQCASESKLCNHPPNEKYILAYILDPTENKQNALLKASEQCQANIICIPNAHLSTEMKENWHMPVQENIDMEDWLYYFKHAEAIITDSFHGSCFSIIFEKPFIAIGNRRRGLERFYSLLSEVGLLNHLVLDPSEIIDKSDLLLNPIDYTVVNSTLAILREKSTSWLIRALRKNNRAEKYSSYDITERHTEKIMQQLEKKIVDLDKRITIQNKQFEIALRDLTMESKDQSESISNQLCEAKKQIQYMENSFSWRLTEPLRKIREWQKRIAGN